MSNGRIQASIYASKKLCQCKTRDRLPNICHRDPTRLVVKVVVATTLFCWKTKIKTKIDIKNISRTYIKNIVRYIAMIQRKKNNFKIYRGDGKQTTKNKDPSDLWSA